MMELFISHHSQLSFCIISGQETLSNFPIQLESRSEYSKLNVVFQFLYTYKCILFPPTLSKPKPLVLPLEIQHKE